MHELESQTAIEDRRLLKLIGINSHRVSNSFNVSCGIYGYRSITLNLKQLCKCCGPNRVIRFMKNNGIKTICGYKKHHCGRPSIIVVNHLNRQFEVNALDKLWITDITYIWTY
ncbi:IS3 family transposase [Vibrio alginolyticus]|uniref:IS3 family transposase n=1 Tax=Vibrio alginolyticus TaxID=663 RepID=UPI003A4C74C5